MTGITVVNAALGDKNVGLTIYYEKNDDSRKSKIGLGIHDRNTATVTVSGVAYKIQPDEPIEYKWDDGSVINEQWNVPQDAKYWTTEIIFPQDKKGFLLILFDKNKLSMRYSFGKRQKVVAFDLSGLEAILAENKLSKDEILGVFGNDEF